MKKCCNTLCIHDRLYRQLQFMNPLCFLIEILIFFHFFVCSMCYSKFCCIMHFFTAQKERKLFKCSYNSTLLSVFHMHTPDAETCCYIPYHHPQTLLLDKSFQTHRAPTKIRECRMLVSLLFIAILHYSYPHTVDSIPQSQWGLINLMGESLPLHVLILVFHDWFFD